MLTQNSKLTTQKYISKLKKKKTFAFLLVLLAFNFYLFNFAVIFAQTSVNENYIIEIGDIDTSPNTQVITPKNDDPLQQPAVEKTGIDSFVQTAPLSFSLSGSLADFGTLNPNNPVTRTVHLSIMSTANDYQVIGYEDHPLTGANASDVLPDTTCDQGNCDEKKEGEWKNNLTYGFGYRCNNLSLILCHAFSDGEYFKQFADLSKHEQPQAVIAGKKIRDKQDAEILFRVNSSGTQRAKSYTNTVTFIAVPNF